MLVLQRRTDERIIIGSGSDRIEVCVCAISRGKVLLGVTAPRDVPVHREEIYDLIDWDGDGDADLGGEG